MAFITQLLQPPNQSGIYCKVKQQKQEHAQMHVLKRSKHAHSKQPARVKHSDSYTTLQQEGRQASSLPRHKSGGAYQINDGSAFGWPALLRVPTALPDAVTTWPKQAGAPSDESRHRESPRTANWDTSYAGRDERVGNNAGTNMP